MIRWMIAIAMAMYVLSAAQAQALTCSIVGDTQLNFGTVDPTSTQDVLGSASITIRCSETLLGTINESVLVCPMLSVGGGGLATDGVNRAMLLGSNRLAYNLYTDVGRTDVWGDDLTYGNSPAIVVPLSGFLFTQKDTPLTMYGRVPGSQFTAAAGAYQSAFTGSQFQIRYKIDDGQGCPTTGSSATRNFTVRATVASTCNVGGSTLDFGTHGRLDVVKTTSTSIDLSCTVGTAYRVSLGYGQNGTSVTTRRMASAGKYVGYRIFRDAARTQDWGNTQALSVTGTGIGSPQAVPVYGQVPVQTTPAKGTYVDTVVVTVTY